MKKVLAIIAGVISGSIILFIGEATTHEIHPRPLGINYMDRVIMLDYIATIPQYVLVIMTFFWLLSSFLGGLVTAVIQPVEWKSAVMITGGILLAYELLNLVLTAPAHPMWMWIVALVGYLPAAVIGGWLIRRKDSAV